ncbi:PadR family transcriptional regulator [Acidianus sulfidivorans JP7]|uniref:PadR family transcriptional regulator n=2 Tax=Acidianus TaxID=12914 RepID=A0A2U9IQD7_9CREN|nr:PadR family transcriptional regulator [Acidianus sulfidivorans JP7]
MMVIRGLLQIFIAYVIYRYGDMYGYEIKKKVEEIHGKKIPHGLLYVTLKRMVKGNILEIYEKDGKKYYKLTEGGKDFLFFHLDVLKRADRSIREIIDYLEQISNINNNTKNESNTKQY